MVAVPPNATVVEVHSFITKLHWITTRQHIEYRITAPVWRCELNLTPGFVLDVLAPLQVFKAAPSLLHREGVLLVTFAQAAIMQTSKAFSW